jgi:hypothetical protein
MFCLPLRLPRNTQDERERIKEEMAEAIARYDGPINKCPPARARGSEQNEEGLQLLTRPWFRARG